MSPAAPPLRIGSLELDAPIAMAPMANVTDVHFHEVLRELGGPGLYTAEMVPSKALARGCEREIECRWSARRFIPTYPMLVYSERYDYKDRNLNCTRQHFHLSSPPNGSQEHYYL